VSTPCPQNPGENRSSLKTMTSKEQKNPGLTLRSKEMPLFRRPLPAGLRLSGARGARATLLREGDARAVIVKLLFFQLAAPGIAAGA